MNIKEVKQLWDKFQRECWEIFESRNKDYADSDDCFVNFKRQAQLEGKSMFDIALQYINGKVVRINMRGKTAKDDNFIDLANYNFICYLMKK